MKALAALAIAATISWHGFQFGLRMLASPPPAAPTEQQQADLQYLIAQHRATAARWRDGVADSPHPRTSDGPGLAVAPYGRARFSLMEADMANDYSKLKRGYGQKGETKAKDMTPIIKGSGRSQMQRGGKPPLPDELQRRQDKRKMPAPGEHGPGS